jgi:hypothetical protein
MAEECSGGLSLMQQDLLVKLYPDEAVYLDILRKGSNLYIICRKYIAEKAT